MAKVSELPKMNPTTCGVPKRAVSREAVPEFTTAASAFLIMLCVSPNSSFTYFLPPR